MEGLISPISSSIKVPLSAASNLPALRSVAPVNAPFPCPNNSLSSNDSDNAAQFKQMKGPRFRSLEKCTVDAGGILMVPANRPTTVDPENLEILSWRSDAHPQYQRVSNFLSETALRRGEAVLARDVQDDSALGLRDESGHVLATSVIAAPIRMSNRSIGLVHLYSTHAKEGLNSNDLEFALAVAETVAMALRTRFREQKLVEDLSKTRNQIDQLQDQLVVQIEIVGAIDAIF